jgi:hypothetical protein
VRAACLCAMHMPPHPSSPHHARTHLTRLLRPYLTLAHSPVSLSQRRGCAADAPCQFSWCSPAARMSLVVKDKQALLLEITHHGVML